MERPDHISLSRLLKFAISLVVYSGTWVVRLLSRLVGRTPPGSCVVIYYHSVPDRQRAQFEKQLDQLVNYAKPISLYGDVVLAPGQRYAAVTFDDGFKNFHDCALPGLLKRGIPSTMFVITNVIGKTFGPDAEEVMSLEQIRSLPESVTIGSHTLSHPLLPRIDLDDATREIALSRSELEEKLNRKISLFSFPFGGFNQKLVEICKSAGYHRVFSTLPYFAFASPKEFVTGRVRVDPTDWRMEFRLKLAGAYRWLPRAFEWKRKLYHRASPKNVGSEKRSAGAMGRI